VTDATTPAQGGDKVAARVREWRRIVAELDGHGAALTG